MSWSRVAVAAGLVDVLSAATATNTPPPSCFPIPPATFNPPAYIVGHPLSVLYGASSFGVDLVQLPLTVAAGIEQTDVVDALIAQAVAAIGLARTLNGAVAEAHAFEARNWRALNVGGADLGAADLILEIRM